MANYATSFDKAGGFSFSEQSIKDLWKEAREFTTGHVSISVELEGGHSVTLNEISELFDDAFIRSNYITLMTISGSRYDLNPTKRISIALRNQPLIGAVGFSISGERRECAAKRTEIENILNGRKLWYSKWIYEMPSRLLIALFIFSGLIQPVIDKIVLSIGLDPSFKSNLIVGFPIYGACLVLASALRPRMFPKVIFEFGKSGTIGRRADFWRNFVGGGILLAFIVGIASTLFLDFIKK